MLGVIGGMGPLASADFFRKLIDATPAACDDEHIPVLIHSVPQLPSRPAAILRGGASPLPALMKARDRLVAAGATMLAMPCNTAHHWHAELAANSVPFPHIADAVAVELPPHCHAHRHHRDGRDPGHAHLHPAARPAHRVAGAGRSHVRQRCAARHRRGQAQRVSRRRPDAGASRRETAGTRRRMRRTCVH